MIGKTISHYRVTAKLGAGGMGEVYRAHDERLERDVALKVLPPETLTDEAARKRFRKEALALSKLNHPNIATIYDFDTQDGVDFLVMEYVEGTTLSEKLSNGPLSEEEATCIEIQNRTFQGLISNERFSPCKSPHGALRRHAAEGYAGIFGEAPAA